MILIRIGPCCACRAASEGYFVSSRFCSSLAPLALHWHPASMWIPSPSFSCIFPTPLPFSGSTSVSVHFGLGSRWCFCYRPRSLANHSSPPSIFILQLSSYQVLLAELSPANRRGQVVTRNELICYCFGYCFAVHRLNRHSFPGWWLSPASWLLSWSTPSSALTGVISGFSNIGVVSLVFLRLLMKFNENREVSICVLRKIIGYLQLRLTFHLSICVF